MERQLQLKDKIIYDKDQAIKELEEKGGDGPESGFKIQNMQRKMDLKDSKMKLLEK